MHVTRPAQLIFFHFIILILIGGEHNLCSSSLCGGSHGSVVGIVTDNGLDDREIGVRAPVRSIIAIYAHHSDRLWGPTSSYLMDTGSPFPAGIKAGV
jgi:hypothetical protein